MVTVIFTVPALPAGEVAVICADEFTVKLVAALPPKSTAVAPFRFTPLMVTEVPPANGPAAGVTPLTMGVVLLKPRSAARVARAAAYCSGSFVHSPGQAHAPVGPFGWLVLVQPVAPLAPVMSQ